MLPITEAAEYKIDMSFKPKVLQMCFFDSDFDAHGYRAGQVLLLVASQCGLGSVFLGISDEGRCIKREWPCISLQLLFVHIYISIFI